MRFGACDFHSLFTLGMRKPDECDQLSGGRNGPAWRWAQPHALYIFDPSNWCSNATNFRAAAVGPPGVGLNPMRCTFFDQSSWRSNVRLHHAVDARRGTFSVIFFNSEEHAGEAKLKPTPAKWIAAGHAHWGA